ncbi:MFS transporter [Streptomyces sp. NPDC002073]|uniref:MFS transporter n=1 Tax=Streptomyces sp. NBC_00239 TaxID=2903640 RepID=UPI002E2C5F78|nr:MFS transporter [Streptomyces sp. NBC_00239]
MTAVATHPSPAPRPSRRSVAATVVGNAVESYDLLAFGLFAPLFAKQFFPSSNPVTSLLGAFAVFGIGVLARPVGGILFGRYADRHGRRPALLLAIVLMTAGSVLIGVSPTYEHIGILAPLLLVVARIGQGISAGGEWPTAAAYLMEEAPENRKCLYGALFSVSTGLGVLTASAIGGGLTAAVGADAMAAWGWRVPFLVGGVFGLVLMVLRNRLAETAVFQEQVRGRRSRGSLRQVMRSHRRPVLLSVLIVGGIATVSGVWSAVVPAMGQRLAPPGTMYGVVMCAVGTMLVLNVPLGMLADKIGATNFLAGVTVVFAVFGSYGYLHIEGTFPSLLLAYGSGVVYLVSVTSVLPKLLSEVFPPEVRVLGMGLPHAVTTAVLGGVVPALATFLGEKGASGWFVAAMVALVVLAVPAAFASRGHVARLALNVPEPALAAAK